MTEHKPQRDPATDETIRLHLKTKLAITPKTASLLRQLGYTNYTDLRNTTPAQLVAGIGALPGVTPTQAESYRRGCRRMVWLATLEEPEAAAKRFQEWTRKALVKMGVWEDGYDELTGVQVAERMEKFL